MAENDIMIVAVLIDNLKHDEVTERLKSVQNLDKIASTLGEKRTREELIPFLCDCTDDDDEVLIALARFLKGATPFVGGEKFAHTILDPLRLLATGDSKIVRDCSIDAIVYVSTLLSDPKSQIVPMVEEFLASEWYNYRTSGVQLAPRCLQIITEQDKRSKLLVGVKNAAADPLPMVRRCVGEVLPILILQCNNSELQVYIKPLMKTLGEDVQDAVRAVSARAIPQFLQQCAKFIAGGNTELNASRKEIYTRFLTTHCQEVSWRTRYMCADLFVHVIEAYLGFKDLSELNTLPRETSDSKECEEGVDPYEGGSVQQNYLTSARSIIANVQICKNTASYPPGPDFNEAQAAGQFAKLLADTEPETRCIAAQRVVRVANRLSVPIIQQYLLPAIDERASSDDTAFVRITIAKHSPYMAQLLGREQMGPLVQAMNRMLEDKDPEVRVTLLGSIKPVTAVVGLQAFGDKVNNCIVMLTEDGNWRIRKQVVESMSDIAQQIDQKVFDDKLKNLCFNWLNDHVNYVRRVAVQTLVKIGVIYGLEWTKKNLLEQVISLMKKNNYLQRNNCLFFIEEIFRQMGGELQESLIEPLLSLSQDGVPNIRFMAAEIMGISAKDLNPENKAKTKARLQAMIADEDVDVKGFSQLALKQFV